MGAVVVEGCGSTQLGWESAGAVDVAGGCAAAVSLVEVLV